MSLVAIATGVLVAVTVTLHPELLRAPAWMPYLAAAAFIVGGGSMLARAYRRARLPEVFVCVLLGVMWVMGLWIALGPGAHQCVGGVAGFRFAASAMACRAAFGLGAVFVAAMVLLIVRSWLQRRAAD